MLSFFNKRKDMSVMIKKVMADMFQEELVRQGIKANELNSSNITKVSIALSSRLAAGELTDRISCHLE